MQCMQSCPTHCLIYFHGDTLRIELKITREIVDGDATLGDKLMVHLFER